MVPITFTHKKNNENLILMVHGFTGGKETWVNENGVSFQDLLLINTNIKSNFDIASFEYFTKFLNPNRIETTKNLMKIFMKKSTTTKKNLDIDSLGKFMKSAIETYCSEYKNIIIIAHSMGGLVTKRYIIDEINEGCCKVKLFLSLAVPHKGSKWASIGKQLQLKNPQIQDLAPLSPKLDQITQEWINLSSNAPQTVYYYGFYDDIVDKLSAIAYQSNEINEVGCDNDHFNISKPLESEVLICKSVTMQLEHFIEDYTFQKSMVNPRFEDNGQLDDELFVIKLLIANVHNKLISDSKKYFFEAEYITKQLLKNGYSKEELEGVYSRLEELYNIYFVQYTSGLLQTSDQLISKIYEIIIRENDSFLKASNDLLNAAKKTGMLNQLANSYDHDIWWAKNNNIKTISAFREARCKDGA